MIQLTASEAMEIHIKAHKIHSIDWIGYCKKWGWIKKSALEKAREYKISGGTHYCDIESVNTSITLYEKAITELQDVINDKYKMEKE